MKKEIEIQVSRGAFGNPYYKVSVYDTERLVNLHRFWYAYGSAGEDLANVFRMLRLAGHGDALDRLALSLIISDPEYNKCATEEMVSREVGFIDQWFEKHGKMPTYADAIEWGRKQAIREACEWLKEELYNSHDRDKYPTVESRSFTLVEELINEFTKAMGERL